MERLHSEPGIDRYTGGLNGQDFSQLEQLLEKKGDTCRVGFLKLL